jgi:hypothetical protein
MDVKVDAFSNDWPDLVPMSPVRRLMALAAALDGVAIERRVVDAHRDQLWGFIENLDQSIPTFDPLVRAIHIVEQDDHGHPTRVTASPGRITFDVRWADGWCLMQSKWYVVGMAVEALDDRRSLYAHMEGIRPPRAKWARAICRPVLRSLVGLHRRTVRHDINGVENEAATW